MNSTYKTSNRLKVASRAAIKRSETTEVITSASTPTTLSLSPKTKNHPLHDHPHLQVFLQPVITLYNLLPYKAMIYNYHLLFKYIIIGDANVGKSSLLLRFLDSKFKDNYESTLGVEFGCKIINVGSTVIKTMIWDTAGQEGFKSIIRSYYKNSIVALLVFDISNAQSFQNLRFWLEQIKNHANQQIRVVLIGSKADLIDKREVAKQTAVDYAKSIGVPYFQASAKAGINVNQIFTEPARMLLEDIESKRFLVSNFSQSIGVKIGNPELQSNQKSSIQISFKNSKKKQCQC